jgi:hypothetical protein
VVDEAFEGMRPRAPYEGRGRPQDTQGTGPGYGERGQREGFGRSPTGRGTGPHGGPMNPNITP